MIILIIIVITIVAMDMAMATTTTTATSFLFLFPIIIMSAFRIPRRIHYVAISWWPDGPWHIQGICRWWWWAVADLGLNIWVGPKWVWSFSMRVARLLRAKNII